MNLSNVLYVFLLSLTIMALVTVIEPSSPTSLCHPDQRDALSQLNHSFSMSGPPPFYLPDFCMGTSHAKTTSWREDEDCCLWEGVTCDNSTGDVVGLDLACARLQGTIDPGSSLFSLRHLRSLSLAGNHFTGVLPTEISRLSKLVSLNLSSNGLEIRDPTMRMLIRNLTEMEELDLSYNDNIMVGPASLMNFSSSLTTLLLFNCSLGGKFPDYIFKLPNIRNLAVSGNRLLTGTLAGFNWSSSLAMVSLSDCSFTGEVPRSIGNLPRLTYLDISGNNLTGYVDLWTFSTLKNLRFLGISRLYVLGEGAKDAGPMFPKLDGLGILEGKLGNYPCFLSSMPQLRALYIIRSIVNEFPGQCTNKSLSFPQIQLLVMTSCNLTKFPSFLSHSKKLGVLDLSGNMIEEIPGWFGSTGINTLQSLILEDNLLKRGLQLPWKRLDSLVLRKNMFEGELPIPVAPSIRAIDASRNRFSGSISPSICQLIHLQNLGLGQNNLTGTIPQCLRSLRDLQFLDLSNNSLTGMPPLPSYSMNYYSVSRNNFSGEISTLLCNATNLMLLDLSNNGFTGTLPQCLIKVTMRLIYMNIRANRFLGSIPEIFPIGSSLTSLDFSENQFEGSLPRSLANCQRLEVLNVGSNKIVDSFPSWLMKLPLKILSLRSNRLHGPISIYEGTQLLSMLRVLDLSDNSFDGNLPDNLVNEMFGMMPNDNLSRDNRYKAGRDAGYMISSLSSFLTTGRYEQFFSVMVDLKGVMTEMEKINSQFVILDLSSNHFGGEIPRNIGQLRLLKGLNFSHNGFMGTIPPSLGNLVNLESLDLSSNHLVGGIPGELTQLTSLGFLDLSQNNLTGPIPLGGHLNTFPDNSFDGNPGLCGIPLTRVCGLGKAESRPGPELSHNEEDKDEGWKYVAMGFASGMVIGISLGYMVLETGKPLWLSRMIIRLGLRRGNKKNRKARRRNARR